MLCILVPNLLTVGQPPMELPSTQLGDTGGKGREKNEVVAVAEDFNHKHPKTLLFMLSNS